MKIAIASDHAGFALKQEMAHFISRLGHIIVDLGAKNAEPSDYPDFAAAVGRALIESTAERDVLICGSGVGVCVMANKMPGIRAARCHDTYSAPQGIEHDDMNVLVIGSRIIGSSLTFDIVTTHVAAKFKSSQERFDRRLNELKEIEQHYMRAPLTLKK